MFVSASRMDMFLSPFYFNVFDLNVESPFVMINCRFKIFEEHTFTICVFKMTCVAHFHRFPRNDVYNWARFVFGAACFLFSW